MAGTMNIKPSLCMQFKKNLSCRSDLLTSPEMGTRFKTEVDTRQKLLKEPPLIEKVTFCVFIFTLEVPRWLH